MVTQLEALQANKGDAAALTQHAMAALLNAARPGVSYDLTADFNEQGCPLK